MIELSMRIGKLLFDPTLPWPSLTQGFAPLPTVCSPVAQLAHLRVRLCSQLSEWADASDSLFL